MYGIEENDDVLVFQPRSIDPPHFVAESWADLNDRVGDIVGGEQCDGCGNNTYELVRQAERRYVAVCRLDPHGDPEFKWPEACGTEYRVTWEKARNTVF